MRRGPLVPVGGRGSRWDYFALGAGLTALVADRPSLPATAWAPIKHNPRGELRETLLLELSSGSCSSSSASPSGRSVLRPERNEAPLTDPAAPPRPRRSARPREPYVPPSRELLAIFATPRLTASPARPDPQTEAAASAVEAPAGLSGATVEDEPIEPRMLRLFGPPQARRRRAGRLASTPDARPHRLSRRQTRPRHPGRTPRRTLARTANQAHTPAALESQTASRRRRRGSAPTAPRPLPARPQPHPLRHRRDRKTASRRPRPGAARTSADTDARRATRGHRLPLGRKRTPTPTSTPRRNTRPSRERPARRWRPKRRPQRRRAADRVPTL